MAVSMQRSSRSKAAGRCSGRKRATRSSEATPLKKSRRALCMTVPATRWSSGCSTSRGWSWRSTNQSEEQVWNVSSSVTEYVSCAASCPSTWRSRRRVGRSHAASARSIRGTARPPCAPACASAAGASLRASAASACSRSAEHAGDLVPERRGGELEAVVVGRPADEHELLVHACQGRCEQEAVAFLLARALTRETRRRQRSPELGRAGGLRRLAAREHALLQTAQDDGAHRRKPGEADADDAHAAPRQPVA